IIGTWIVAAVQFIDPLRPVAASTALASCLGSAVVGRDRRSMSTGRGKQTIVGAIEPPDSKGTNRTSIAVADISPAAWRSALSRAVSSRHWEKSPQRFSLVVTVSKPEKITCAPEKPQEGLIL